MSRRTVAIGCLAIAVILGGCASAGLSPTDGPSASAAATAVVSPSAPPTAAVVSPSPTATPDLEHPVGVIAIGHSGLTGEGTGMLHQAIKANSWATGTDPEIDSVYLRMVAAIPETATRVANFAIGGAPAATLDSQARSALALVPAPALAIIQTVDNDIECDPQNVAEVGGAVADALATIHAASPNTKILVVGQPGRPSVEYIKELVALHPDAKAGLTWGDDCTFFDADGTLNPAGFEKLTAAIDTYEAETARVCAAVPGCATDGGVRRAWVDRIEYYSPDYAHFNKVGQAAEAAQIWPVVADLLGLT